MNLFESKTFLWLMFIIRKAQQEKSQLLRESILKIIHNDNYAHFSPYEPTIDYLINLFLFFNKWKIIQRLQDHV